MYTIKDGIFVGLSTDTKPTGIDRGGELPKPIPNGFKLYEMDTGSRFLYDAENKTWVERQSGASGLPDVTAEDDGKFLGVDEGEWVAVNGPTSDVVVATFTASSSTTLSGQGVMGTLSITISELVAAFNAGKAVFVKAISSDSSQTMMMSVTQASLFGSNLTGSIIDVNNSGLNINCATLYTMGGAAILMNFYTKSVASAGKTYNMKVDNGVLTIEHIAGIGVYESLTATDIANLYSMTIDDKIKLMDASTYQSYYLKKQGSGDADALKCLYVDSTTGKLMIRTITIVSGAGGMDAVYHTAEVSDALWN